MSILVFDPVGSALAWSEMPSVSAKSPRTVGRTTPGEMATLLASAAPATVVYALPNGGGVVTDLVSELDDALLARVSSVIALMPEQNSLTMEAIRTGRRLWPGARHVMVCDSAVFADMPAEAALYAVPPRLRGRGIRRVGLNGLAHWRALERARGKSPERLPRAITVYLAPQTSVAAFEGSRAMDTSAGFSPVEGLPSLTSCGDIDPSLALLMVASGMHFRDVQRVLMEQSGLRALAGRDDLSFAEVLDPPCDARVAFARDVWMAGMIKAIGAAAAVLGGVDAIVFAGAPDVDAPAAARQLAGRLAPLDIRLADAGPATPELTVPDSPVKMFAFTNDRWHNLALVADRFLQRGV